MALPPSRPLLWHPAVETICALIPASEEVYLVGGAVRDAWLQRPLRDIDLATPDDGRPLARRIANALHGAYYSLDPERGVGRALIPWEGAQLVVDVAQFRGPDLLTDLQKRDFTLNAMAVRVAGDLQTVIDPLGGQHDLAQKRLRQCSPTSIADDPVRALRAVRASLTFGLTIEPATRESIRQAGPRLGTASTERVRDEFFNLLDARHPAGALRALKQLGLLAQIIPQTEAMQHVAQSPPHEFDLWNHTLAVIGIWTSS